MKCPICRGTGKIIGEDKMGVYRQITCVACHDKKAVRPGAWFDLVSWLLFGRKK